MLIIGILAAVAVPQYQKAVMRSRYATLKNMTKSIADAQEVYYLAHGQYAERFDELDIDPGGTPNSKLDFQHNFDWGDCIIWDRSSIVCEHAGLRYIIYLRYSNRDAGARYCVASVNNNLNHQICQQETGKSSNGTTWYLYEYTK